jgi:hypothetical protein
MIPRAAPNVGDPRYAEWTSPCALQTATYDVGVTFTTIRRPHSAQ